MNLLILSVNPLGGDEVCLYFKGQCTPVDINIHMN